MTPLRLFLIASLLVPVLSSAEEINIGSSTFSLPAGWQHFPSEGQAMMPQSGSIRDSTGMIWIHYVSSPTTPEDHQNPFSDWILDKEGESHGFTYRLIRKSVKATIPYVYFPELKTYFVPRILNQGYLDVQESFRMGTPDVSALADQKLDSTIKCVLDRFTPKAKK